MRKPDVRAGTRRSPLAVKQTQLIRDALQAAWGRLDIVLTRFNTLGDRTLGALVPPPGGKGLFTAALEDALLGGEIDLAVHSLKDLPTDSSPGLMIGAVHKRTSAGDVLIGHKASALDALPAGAAVGTSSPRRAAQLKHARRDLVIQPVRGNVGTRISMMERGEVDAVVLAAAGLERLGVKHAGAAALPSNVMLPAPGQGALAIQCRVDDHRMRKLLSPINCAATCAEVMAERSFMRALGGGCAAPMAALGTAFAGGSIELQGLVCDVEGTQMIRVTDTGRNPIDLGRRLAEESVARGAGDLIENA